MEEEVVVVRDQGEPNSAANLELRPGGAGLEAQRRRFLRFPGGLAGAFDSEGEKFLNRRTLTHRAVLAIGLSGCQPRAHQELTCLKT